METFRTLGEINFTRSKLVEAWNKWVQKFDNYLIDSEKNEKDKETGSMARFSAPYLETTILLVLLAWLVGGGVASLRQGSMR
ncbi:hypothetical protein TNCV_4792781 [Trichonephila clavipes]|nr:hypothetical protein TNCV_4792781 [Trichonephila clavipes]